MAARRRKLASDINVVPYIDVMLVLLIIFMVTAPLLTQGVEVDLPEANSEPMTASDEPLTLFIDQRGRYFLDVGAGKEQALGDDELVRRVRAVLKNNPAKMLVVRGDRRVVYERVAYGMSLLQEAGAKKIGFVTDPAGNPAADEETGPR